MRSTTYLERKPYHYLETKKDSFSVGRQRTITLQTRGEVEPVYRSCLITRCRRRTRPFRFPVYRVAKQVPSMFHQTVFYPSRHSRNGERINYDSSSSSTHSSLAFSPEKASSYFQERSSSHHRRFGLEYSSSHHRRFGMEHSSSHHRRFGVDQNSSHHRQFGLELSSTTFSSTSTSTSTTSIGDYQNVLLPQAQQPTPSFGTFVLNPLRLPPTSIILASSTNDRRSKHNASPVKESSFKKSDEDTATTASITTNMSSPTPSFLSNLSSLDNGGEEIDQLEFDLDFGENFPDWIANSGNRSLEEDDDIDDNSTHKVDYNIGERKRLNYGSDSEEEDDDIDDTSTHKRDCNIGRHTTDKYEGDYDDEICSCSTPVLANVSRPQQLFQEEHQQHRSSVITTTTTTTTTTTERRMSSIVNKSTSISRTVSEEDLVLSHEIFSELDEDTEGIIPTVAIQRESYSNNISAMDHYQNSEASSAIATTSNSNAIAKKSSCHCKSCSSKQRKIDQQRQELIHMKGMMKKLCLLLADQVRAQEELKNRNNKLRASYPKAPNSNAITDGLEKESSMVSLSNGTLSQLSNGDNADNVQVDDPLSRTVSTPTLASSASISSLSTSSTISSKFVPRLHRPRIASLPVTKVGKDCPRTRNERILVSGCWGTYSGPSLFGKNKPHESDNKCEDEDEEDESSNAQILVGCVVKMDDNSMYVGSLSRNDTGSYIFHPPGTLYDQTGKPVKRLR